MHNKQTTLVDVFGIPPKGTFEASVGQECRLSTPGWAIFINYARVYEHAKLT
jgi:hypothetical protein